MSSWRALNPRLVYLALKGYLAGPYEHRPALDEVVQFQTGLAFMTGPPGQPLRAGASVIDIMGAVFGVVAAQAALRERDITGKGQRVSQRAVRERRVPDEHAHGRHGRDRPARRGRCRRGAAPGRSTRCSRPPDGGQLFIGVTSDQQWARFVEEFGLQELAADPRLATNVHAPGGAGLADPGAAGGAGDAAAGRGRAALRALPTCRGRRSASRATCSPTRICWRPAGCSTCSSRASAAATARSPACRPCRSSSAPTAQRPGITPPAAAHGRAQRRGAGRSRLHRRRDRRSRSRGVIAGAMGV